MDWYIKRTIYQGPSVYLLITNQGMPINLLIDMSQSHTLPPSVDLLYHHRWPQNLGLVVLLLLPLNFGIILSLGSASPLSYPMASSFYSSYYLPPPHNCLTLQLLLLDWGFLVLLGFFDIDGHQTMPYWANQQPTPAAHMTQNIASWGGESLGWRVVLSQLLGGREMDSDHEFNLLLWCLWANCAGYFCTFLSSWSHQHDKSLAPGQCPINIRIRPKHYNRACLRRSNDLQCWSLEACCRQVTSIMGPQNGPTDMPNCPHWANLRHSWRLQSLWMPAFVTTPGLVFEKGVLGWCALKRCRWVSSGTVTTGW